MKLRNRQSEGWPKLHLSLHRAIPEDNTLRSEWDDLVLHSTRPEVFYTYEWALALSRSYSSSLRPLLILAREAESLVGLVALATNGSEREVSFLAATTGDYCDFLCRPELLPEFARRVFSELRHLGCRKLSLANMPADSATVHAIGLAARESGYSIFSRPAYLCGQVMFASAESRQSVKESLRRKQMVRRHLKGLAKIAPVSLRHLTSREQITGALPGFAAAHVSRFLSMGRISTLVHPERRAFLAELAALLSERQWVTLSTLMLGEQPVAWNYGFQFCGSWFWYQPTFESSLERFYPGFCLLAKIIEEACELPQINLVDLGLGDEAYKQRFATDRRQTLHLTAAKSAIIHVREVLRYWGAATVKRLPPLENGLRAVLRVVSSSIAWLGVHGISGLIHRLGRRMSSLFCTHAELVVFEFPGDLRPISGAPTDVSLHIQPLDFRLVGNLTMKYADDPDTLNYLLRAANRLQNRKLRGFALVDGDGVAVHFCWVADYAGFYASELDCQMEAPSPRASLIYDCWTPALARGKGFYGAALSQVASQLALEGREPWIFSAASNRSSVRGIEKAGFARRFTLARKRVLFIDQGVHRQAVDSAPPISA